MPEEDISRDVKEHKEEPESNLSEEAESRGISKKIWLLLIAAAVVGIYIWIEFLSPVERPPTEVVPPPIPKAVAPESVELSQTEKITPPASEIKETSDIKPVTQPEIKYAVQIGTYIYKSSMDTVLKELKEKGFSPYEKVGISEIASYRVDVGEFQNAHEVRNIVKKLVDNNIEVKFKIKSKGLYTLSAGSFYDKSKGEEFKDKLIGKGYPARISTEKGKKRVYILRAGEFKDRAEAEKTRTALSGKGINSIIVKY